MGKLKKIVVSALIVGMLCACTGCGLFDSEVNELNGTIKGNTYNISFYSNEGEKFMEMSGQKIDIRILLKNLHIRIAGGDIPRLFPV